MSRTDVHQHVWPDAFRRRLEQRRQAPFLRERRLVLPIGGEFEVDPAAYAPEARLDELERNGLGRAFVSLAPTTEPTADLVEAWHAGAEGLEQESGGRLLPLGYEAAVVGFRGALVGAPQLPFAGRLFEELERAGQFAFVHPGAARAADTPAWVQSGVTYTHQMVAAYATWLSLFAHRHRRLKIVFALLAGGAPFQIERFIRRGLDPRAPFSSTVFFDTSSYGERAVELCLQTFGASQLLFGSDAPIDALADALCTTARLGDAVEAHLLESNPSVLLAGVGAQCAG